MCVCVRVLSVCMCVVVMDVLASVGMYVGFFFFFERVNM